MGQFTLIKTGSEVLTPRTAPQPATRRACEEKMQKCLFRSWCRLGPAYTPPRATTTTAIEDGRKRGPATTCTNGRTSVRHAEYLRGETRQGPQTSAVQPHVH
jgi:hypothetical protein